MGGSGWRSSRGPRSRSSTSPTLIGNAGSSARGGLNILLGEVRRRVQSQLIKGLGKAVHVDVVPSC
eukprot:3502857-Alexandrium_andersonii.AAC.1